MNLNDELIVEQSMPKTLLMFVGSIMFVTLGIIFINLEPHDVFVVVVSCFSIIFFGICGYFILNKLLNPKPVMIIDKDGITDNSTMFAVGFIPWENISQVDMITFGGNKMITIKLFNEDKILKDLSFGQSRNIKFTNKFGLEHIQIPLNYAKGNAQFIFDKVVEYRKKWGI